MLKVESNQIWESKNDQGIQRIIVNVFDDEQQSSGKQSVLYIEYWKDKDQMFKEGFCGVNHLKTWGRLVEGEINPSLIDRAYGFLVQDRFSRSKMMLQDLASVVVDSNDRSELLNMINRIDEMSSTIILNRRSR